MRQTVTQAQQRNTLTTPTPWLLAAATVLMFFIAGCGGSADSASNGAELDQVRPASEAQGIRRVTAQAGADIQNEPPEDLVILDVRTQDEFAEGHLEGAVMLDFYDEEFAAQLAALDPEVPYLLYCRSGNRSGQTASMMSELGFTDVADIDGGILAWTQAGLPTTTG